MISKYAAKKKGWMKKTIWLLIVCQTFWAAEGMALFAAVYKGGSYDGYSSSTGQPDQTSSYLSFTTQPPDAVAGKAFPSNVVATVYYASGGVDTTARTVNLSISNNPGGGTLDSSTESCTGGTCSDTTSSGVATFSNLVVDKPGSLYTLSATATSVT
ncbi:MAG TPA: hypothetical protein PKL97_07130, partial [Candidatus Omnitrophota bacterium]|nr:hypothetical protein [Candidatus Omnitrophota bacterium]